MGVSVGAAQVLSRASARGWTRAPSELFVIVPELSSLEHSLISKIVRETDDRQREWAAIKIPQFIKTVGVSRQAVYEALRQLEKHSYIEIRRTPGRPAEYKAIMRVGFEN